MSMFRATRGSQPRHVRLGGNKIVFQKNDELIKQVLGERAMAKERERREGMEAQLVALCS